MTCKKCEADATQIREQAEYRCDLVARYCVHSSAPSRCSRAHRGTDLVEAYYTLYPDGHYFDDDAMRFFDSRVGHHERTPRGNYLFVTSEKNHKTDWREPDYKRKWTVRLLRMDAKSVAEGVMVEDVSDFQEYASRGGADRRLRAELGNY